jgi:hypothetical protein
MLVLFLSAILRRSSISGAVGRGAHGVAPDDRDGCPDLVDRVEGSVDATQGGLGDLEVNRGDEPHARSIGKDER